MGGMEGDLFRGDVELRRFERNSQKGYARYFTKEIYQKEGVRIKSSQVDDCVERGDKCEFSQKRGEREEGAKSTSFQGAGRRKLIGRPVENAKRKGRKKPPPPEESSHEKKDKKKERKKRTPKKQN